MFQTLWLWVKTPWLLLKLWWACVKLAWATAKAQDEAVRDALLSTREKGNKK